MNKSLLAIIVIVALIFAAYMIWNGVAGVFATLHQIDCGSPYGNTPRVSEGCSEVIRQWR